MKDSNGNNIVITFVVDYSMDDQENHFTWFEIQSAATSEFYAHISNLSELPEARSSLKSLIEKEFPNSTRVDFPLTLSSQKVQQRTQLGHLNGTPKHKIIDKSVQSLDIILQNDLYEFYKCSPNGVIAKSDGTCGSGNLFIKPELSFEAFIDQLSSAKAPYSLEHLEMAFSESYKQRVKQRTLFFYDTETAKQIIIPIHTKLLDQANFDCHKVETTSDCYTGYLPKLIQLDSFQLHQWGSEVAKAITNYYRSNPKPICEISRDIINEYNQTIAKLRYLGRHAPLEPNCDYFHSANPGLLSSTNLKEYQIAHTDMKGEFHSLAFIETTNSSSPDIPFHQQRHQDAASSNQTTESIIPPE
ncbi:hypothetical protein L3V82_03090 [Thiotrichales bacterium 19S3-7]|nr:hypothetical protein [Thiotrichales bacterium 19S3-7]MCF6801155.1 hypothetical protein [Thiotrichales bacterium 19S3-11]